MIWHDLSNLEKYHDTRIHRIGQSILGARNSVGGQNEVRPVCRTVAEATE